MKKINYQQKSLNVHLISFLAIAIALASPWFDLSVSNHSFVKTYVAGIGVGALMLVTLWMRRNEANTVFHLSWIKISWLSLFILGTLSIFWSVNAGFAITKWMIWFTTFCAFIVGYHFRLNEENFIKLAWGLLIAAFMIAGIGILQYLFDPFTLTQAATPSSTFGNKNMTTQPIVLIWPLALFLLFSRQIKNQHVWALTTLTSLLMVFVFYTKTRASWVSILGEIVLIAGFLLVKHRELRGWISWNKNKTYAALFALGLFFLLVNFNESGWVPSLGDAAETFSRIGSDAAEGNARFNIWAVAIDMIKASPVFGTGLGSWFHNEIQGGFGTHNVMNYQRVHNDFLELGVEVGIIGMILLLIASIAASIAVFKIVANDNKTNAWFYFLLWVALSGSFVQMQFSFPYQLAMPATLLGLYLGFIAKHSEQLIQPIKLIRRKTSALYHQSIKGFWLLVMIVVSAVYLDWINTYSTLNELNKRQKLHLVERAIPSIYHLELQNILGFLGNAYLKRGDYDVVIIVEEQVLKYWPNANSSLYRYGYALMKKKRYQEALKVIEHLKKVSGKGYLSGYILELQLYHQQKQHQRFQQTFSKLLNMGEQELSLSRHTYPFLIQFSLTYNELLKYVEPFYQKYVKHHPYNCSVENNIASYYIVNKQYKKAREHVDIILNEERSVCLKPAIVDILKQKGF